MIWYTRYIYMCLDTYVRWSHIFIFLWGIRFFQLLCVLSSVFICFPPEIILHSRVIGACPVTTDCIVAMTSCENNNNNRRALISPRRKLTCCTAASSTSTPTKMLCCSKQHHALRPAHSSRIRRTLRQVPEASRLYRTHELSRIKCWTTRK